MKMISSQAPIHSVFTQEATSQNTTREVDISSMPGPPRQDDIETAPPPRACTKISQKRAGENDLRSALADNPKAIKANTKVLLSCIAAASTLGGIGLALYFGWSRKTMHHCAENWCKTHSDGVPEQACVTRYSSPYGAQPSDSPSTDAFCDSAVAAMLLPALFWCFAGLPALVAVGIACGKVNKSLGSPILLR